MTPRPSRAPSDSGSEAGSDAGRVLDGDGSRRDGKTQHGESPTLPSPTLIRGASAVRPTVAARPSYRVATSPGPAEGFRPDSDYVRRFWVAALGPGAVEDLLRLIRAGARGSLVRRPLFLSPLIVSGLATVDGGTIAVASRIPPVPHHLTSRMTPAIRREHTRWLQLRSAQRLDRDDEEGGNLSHRETE